MNIEQVSIVSLCGVGCLENSQNASSTCPVLVLLWLQLARRPLLAGAYGIGSASISAWARMAPVVRVLCNTCAMRSAGVAIIG